MAVGELLQTTAGLENNILRPKIYFAPKGTIMPARNKTVGAPWPAGWKLIPRTVNGLGITFANPKQDFVCDEEGVYDTTPSGGAAVNLAVQPATPSMDFLQLISGLIKDTLAAGSPSGHKLTHLYDLDDEGEQESEFMLGFEGKVQPNSLFDEEANIWGIAWRADPTSNPQWRAAKTGTDARNSPTVDLRALPYTVPSAQCGTGFDAALMAKRKRRCTIVVMPTASS